MSDSTSVTTTTPTTTTTTTTTTPTATRTSPSAAVVTDTTSPTKPKDEEYKTRALPTIRKCTEEEYEQVVTCLTKDLRPYQLDLWNTLKAFHSSSSSSSSDPTTSSSSSSDPTSSSSSTTSSSTSSIDFPATLTNNERQTVHHLADILGLSHESTGRGQKRFIRCQKKKDTTKSDSPSFTEMYFFKGYIGLMGPCVDSSATQVLARIPSDCIEPRVKRDGPKHHITILTKKELKVLLKKPGSGDEDAIDDDAIAKLLVKLSEELKDNWEDMGLGRTTSGVQGTGGAINEAYYKIVLWNDANKFRRELGLPEKHFHITIGYRTEDIHDVNKDLSTLVSTMEQTIL